MIMSSYKGKNGPQIGGHPSDNIPVALAVGEARRSPGRAVLASIAIGYEIFGRLKGLMDRKGAWDGVTISGFVAPVMAGRLMGLDARPIGPCARPQWSPVRNTGIGPAWRHLRR